MPAVDFGRRRGEGTPAEDAAVDDLEAISGPASIVPADGALLDGGFVRTGRPISVLPGDPGPATRRGAELSLSELASDVEAVSLRDLEVVLGPASAPPAWSGAPAGKLEEAASGLRPRSTRRPPKAEEKPKAHFFQIDEPPPAAKKPRAPEVDSGMVDIRRLAAESMAGNAKPSFFRVDSLLPPPSSEEIPVITDDEPPPPSSGRADLGALLSPDGDRHGPRSDDLLLQLNGGIFAESPPAPPVALDAPIAPVLPLDRVPPSTRSLPVEEAAQEHADPRSPARSSVAPDPVVSERRQGHGRRSGLGGWVAGGALAAAVATLIAWRLGTAPAVAPPPRETATSTAEPVRTAEPPPAPLPPPVEPTAPALPSSTPSAAREPLAKRAPEPVRTNVPATTATPPPTHAQVPAPAPAPAGDFDASAARAALAAAGSAASACKQPDDPGGGARVSVTFAPSGRVTIARVTGSYQGTPTGSCIARAFRTISVPAFGGEPVTVSKDIAIR
jgi:hypothetical protein